MGWTVAPGPARVVIRPTTLAPLLTMNGEENMLESLMCACWKTTNFCSWKVLFAHLPFIMVIELGVQCHVITVLSNTMNRMCYWLLCKSKCIGHSNFVAIDMKQNFQNPPSLPSLQSISPLALPASSFASRWCHSSAPGCRPQNRA